MKSHWMLTALFGAIACTAAVGLTGSRAAQATQNRRASDADTETWRHAAELMTKGRKVFRHDTFGDEEFWGGRLRLHEAIAGEANGGVGPGVSPAEALAVGLKVDVDALPRQLVRQLKIGDVDLQDPATTLALLRLNSVVGLTGVFDSGDRLAAVGIQCALCHSTVDDSLVPGIGQRRDGWANRDLDVGAIVALAPGSVVLLQPPGSRTKQRFAPVLRSWGPGKFDAALGLDGKAFRPDGASARHTDPARVRARRREPPYVDRMGLGDPLERVRRQPGDARQRDVLRSAARRRRTSFRSPRPTASATSATRRT